jgi:hypothetical protein
MRISALSYLLLCASLSAPLAWAQDIAVPNREQRQGMSYKEYSDFREKMRLRMEKMRADERNPPSAENKRTQEEQKQTDSERTYGKGYDSRSHNIDRPDTADRRPERPRVERFNRIERMRP